MTRAQASDGDELSARGGHVLPRSAPLDAEELRGLAEELYEALAAALLALGATRGARRDARISALRDERGPVDLDAERTALAAVGGGLVGIDRLTDADLADAGHVAILRAWCDGATVPEELLGYVAALGARARGLSREEASIALGRVVRHARQRTALAALAPLVVSLRAPDPSLHEIATGLRAVAAGLS